MARQAGSGAPRVGSREYRAQTRRPAPKPVQRSQTFGPVRPPSFKSAQQQAARKVERARQQAPAAHQPLPQFPVLPKYTPKQREQIIRTQQHALINRKAHGEDVGQAIDRIHRNGTRQDRQQLDLLHRALFERAGNGDAVLGAHRLAVLGGRAAARYAVTPHARPAPRRTPGVFSPITAAAAFLGSPERNAFVAAAPGFAGVAAPVGRDLISLPRNVVISGAQIGKAGFQAAKGNPKPAEQLWKSIKQTDPVALAAQGRWSEAMKAVGQHPLNSVLEVSGIGRGALTGAGRLGRVGLERDAAALPGTALTKSRQFSANPVTKAVQVASDDRKFAQARDLRAEAAKLDRAGEPERADTLRAKAAQVDPRIMNVGQVEHRADVRESMGQPLRRRGRTQVMEEMKPTYVKPREGGHLQRLNVEGSVPIQRLDAEGNFDVHGQISIPHMRDQIDVKLAKLQAEERSLPYRLRRLNLRTQKHLRELKDRTDAQLLNVAHRSLNAAAVTNRLDEANVARGLLDPQEARIARLKTYAFEHMDARVGKPPEGGAARLLDRNGDPLHPDQIERHMVSRGVDPQSVAFVSQRPTSGTVGAYNMRWAGAKGANTQTRTGAAVIQGLVDTHPRNLTANAVRLQQLEAANINWEHGLSEVALRKSVHEAGKAAPLERFDTRTDAAGRADSLYARTGMRWRPIMMVPWKGREAQLQHLLDHADQEGFTAGGRHPISEAIQAAVKEDASGDGPWALVPDAWAKRIDEHSQVYASVHPTLRAINGAFRTAVLPFSLKWLTGNFTEAALRTVVQSPRVVHNYSTYKRVLKAVERYDPQEAATLQDMVGVGHYGGQGQSMVHVGVEQFAQSRWAPVAKALSVARNTPGPKQLADLVGRYTHFVFNGVNEALERPWRQAMAGHHIRMQLLDSSRVPRIAQRAIEDAAKGLRNTNAQVELADSIRRAYGQYEAWSPQMRKLALQYTPFLPWSINALNFLGRVLPIDHPILTAAIAAADSAFTDYRQKHGLEEGKPGAVPSFLLGTLPTAHGGHLNVTRYTPAGFFADPLNTVAGNVLPQFSGVLDAFKGTDWKGKELKNSDGSPYNTYQRLGYAAAQASTSLVPGLNILANAVGGLPGVKASPGKTPVSRIWYSQDPVRVTKAPGQGSGKAAKPTSSGVDWRKVNWDQGSGGVDWGKVNWAAGR